MEKFTRSIFSDPLIQQLIIRMHWVILILLSTSLQGQDLSGIRICLDPGHGGHTSDDRQIFLPNGIIYWESEGVFEAANHLKDILESLGAEVLVTRTDNSDESDIALSERSAMANAFDADFFQSLHTNGGGGNYSLVLYKEVNGLPAFPEAKFMSDLMAPILTESMKTTVSYSRGDMTFLGFNLGVLRNASMPSVLSEASFHDLPAEGLRLKNSEYLKNYAWASAKSILSYFQKPGFTTGRVGGVVTDITSGEVINEVMLTCEPAGQNYTGDLNYNGFYAIGNLNPGNYILHLSKEGYLPDSATITITANQYLDLDLTLQYYNNGYPNPDFYITGLPAGAGEMVQFNASKSTDDGEIVMYQWDFGDGSALGEGVISSHAFQADGEYTVSLTLTDDEGKQSTISKNVAISTSAPEAPKLLSVIGGKDHKSIHLSWAKNAEQNIQFYKIYYALNDIFSFSILIDSIPSTQNQYTITNLGFYAKPVYFKVIAQNINQLTSEPGNIYSAMIFPEDEHQSVLIVDGFNRRASYTPKTHKFVGDYLVSVAANGSYRISSCSNSAVADSSVQLTDFDIVFWFLGDESTANETFSNTEQAKVKEYLKNGGKLFVTGAEVGWDLYEKGTASDRQFYGDYLKAAFLHDGGAGRAPAWGIAGSGFETTYLFFGLVYPEDFPDEIGPFGGSELILKYNNDAGAGIKFRGKFSDSQKEGALVYIGFPLESVKVNSQFTQFVKKVLEFLNDSNVDVNEEIMENPQFRLYPNVAENHFFIAHTGEQTEEINIDILNLNGQKVNLTINRMMDPESIIHIPIDDLKPGNYLVRLRSKTEEFMFKLIKP